MPIRVLIADDQPLVRQGVSAVLSLHDGLRLVGEAVNGSDAVHQVGRCDPDIVLMDVNMPRMDGIEATRRICASERGAKVIILTVYDEDDTIFDALRAGASGFVLKDAPTDKLVEAIREVADGRALLSPHVTRRLIREFARRPALSSRTPGQLTGREHDVFTLLVQGYNNDEIARILVLGESTVKSHVQHLYRKLEVRDRVQLVIYAHENGLVGTASHPSVGVRPREGDRVAHAVDGRHAPGRSLASERPPEP